MLTLDPHAPLDILAGLSFAGWAKVCVSFCGGLPALCFSFNTQESVASIPEPISVAVIIVVSIMIVGIARPIFPATITTNKHTYHQEASIQELEL